VDGPADIPTHLAWGPDNRLVEEGGWTYSKTQRTPHGMYPTTHT